RGRACRVLLRARDARGDRGRPEQHDSSRRPGRPAPAHTRPDGPLPGLLLRRACAEAAAAMSVVVVGGGPAGLACALELRRRAVPDVVVLDREAQAGGIPPHCPPQGFGLGDPRRPRNGPGYARRYVELAREAGVELRTASTVTGWSPDAALDVTTPAGRDV